MRSSAMTGISRVTIDSYLAKIGMAAMWASSSRRRSAPSVVVARTWNVSSPTSTVATGFDFRLYHQAEFVGLPLFEPTMTYRSPSRV